MRAVGKTDEALEAYRAALKLDPALALAHANLGQMLADRGQLPEGLEHCREAVRHQPNLAAAHNNLGNVLRALDRWAEAGDAYTEAIRLKPDLAVAHANLGLVPQQQGKPAVALRHIRRATELGADDAEVWRQLANSQGLAEDWVEAIACCERPVNAPGAASVSGPQSVPELAESTLEEKTSSHQPFPDADAVREIDRQDLDRGTSRGGAADEHWTGPAKMLCPMLLPRMEQRDDGPRARVDSSEVGTFMEIAEVTRLREVVGRISAAVLPRDNVFNVEGNRWHGSFRQLAILTAVLGTVANKNPERRLHVGSRSANATCASTWRSVRSSSVSTEDSYSARSSTERSPSVHLSARTSRRAWAFLASLSFRSRRAASGVRQPPTGSRAQSRTDLTVEYLMS